MTLDKLAKSSFLLFADNLILAIGGWAFWLITTQITSSTEIGYASSYIALITTVSGIAVFGLEFPILSNINKDRSLFFKMLILESLLHVSLIPLIFFLGASNPILNDNYGLALLSSILLILTGVGFVSKFSLLGLLDPHIVLALDIGGTIIRLITAAIFLLNRQGAEGIILSSVLSAMVVVIPTTIIAGKKMGLSYWKFDGLAALLKSGLSNFPNKLSKLMIQSISVVFLSWIGLEASTIGIYYIAQMIAIAAGSLAVSLAMMALPVSSIARSDQSMVSLKFGIAFSLPIISLITVAPDIILGLIGKAYVSVDLPFRLLGFAILPYIMVSNAVTSLNNNRHIKKLVLLGIVEMTTFLISFFVLSNSYGLIGAAMSILLAFTASSIISTSWLGKGAAVVLTKGLVNIIVSSGVGYFLSYLSGNNLIGLIIGLATSCALVFVLRSIRIAEVATILNIIGSRK